METPSNLAAAPVTTTDDAPTIATMPVPTRRQPPSRRAIVWWVVGITGVLALAAAAVLAQVSASRSFDAAAAQLQEAVSESNDGWMSLDAERAGVAGGVLSAEQIVESAGNGLAGQKAREALSDAAVAASDSADEAAELLDDGLRDAEVEKPFWAWQLWQGAAELDARAAAADSAGDAMAEAEAELESADQGLETAAVAVFTSVEAVAKKLEKRNVSALATIVLDFRDAAQAVVAQTDSNSAASVAFSTYAKRAQLLARSNKAELEQKAGPLSATRLEIEAFARSMSGGVVLDFDWAPIVNGMGYDWGMGGTATWDAARGGLSTISLSNSVAEQWPSADARALVAHEVGHAITAKCYGKFDWESSDANEEWATAWAISKGHTAIGNGVQAYGYPSQRMIDKAATCR